MVLRESVEYSTIMHNTPRQLLYPLSRTCTLFRCIFVRMLHRFHGSQNIVNGCCAFNKGRYTASNAYFGFEVIYRLLVGLRSYSLTPVDVSTDARGASTDMIDSLLVRMRVVP
jgi:hypothetical protein